MPSDTLPGMDRDAIIEVTALIAFLIFLFAGTVYAYVAGPIPFTP